LGISFAPFFLDVVTFFLNFSGLFASWVAAVKVLHFLFSSAMMAVE